MIRVALPAEVPTVLAILEGALLDVEDRRLRTLVSDDASEGTVLVAAADDRLLGALVLDREEVTAVAVRPGRRGQGLGSRLVLEALDRVDGEVVAEFDADVGDFYESLGFSIEAIDGEEGTERYRGRLE